MKLPKYQRNKLCSVQFFFVYMTDKTVHATCKLLILHLLFITDPSYFSVNLDARQFKFTFDKFFYRVRKLILKLLIKKGGILKYFIVASVMQR